MVKMLFTYNFDSPWEKYEAHSGQVVSVKPQQNGAPCRTITADGGWEGYAYPDELSPVPEPSVSPTQALVDVGYGVGWADCRLAMLKALRDVPRDGGVDMFDVLSAIAGIKREVSK